MRNGFTVPFTNVVFMKVVLEITTMVVKIVVQIVTKCSIQNNLTGSQTSCS